MSYARIGEHSDVYIYPDVQGGVTCEGCGNYRTLDATLAHLAEHEAKGHRCGVWSTPHRGRQPTVRLRTWAALHQAIRSCRDVEWPDAPA